MTTKKTPIKVSKSFDQHPAFRRLPISQWLASHQREALAVEQVLGTIEGLSDEQGEAMFLHLMADAIPEKFGFHVVSTGHFGTISGQREDLAKEYRAVRIRQARAGRSKWERAETRRKMIAEQIDAGKINPRAIFEFIKAQNESLLYSNKKQRVKQNPNFISPESMMRDYSRHTNRG